MAFDLVCAALAPLAAFWVRDPTLFNREDGLSIAVYWGAAFFVSILSFISFRLSHILPQYFSFRDAADVAKASGWAVAISSVIMFSATRLEDVPRSIPIIHFFTLSTSLVAGRLWRRTVAHRRDLGTARFTKAASEQAIILVGVTRLAWFYVRLLDSFAQGSRRIVGIIDFNRSLVGRTMFGHIVLGLPDDIEVLIDDFHSHGIVVSELVICDQRPEVLDHYVAKLGCACRERGIALTDFAKEVALEPDLGFDKIQLDPPHPLRRYLRFRPILDATISALVLISLAPVMALVAVAITVTIGAPVVFWQRRLGKNGYPIYVYKFRSMRNPVNRRGRRLSLDERKLPLGEFLRATRLDELPQLYNVARGDMALIGPRPLLPEDQPQDATIRLSAAPGITGWAQIHGGKLVSVEDKNAMDEYYIRHASLALDATIIAATVRTIIFGDKLRKPPQIST